MRKSVLNAGFECHWFIFFERVLIGIFKFFMVLGDVFNFLDFIEFSILRNVFIVVD